MVGEVGRVVVIDLRRLESSATVAVELRRRRSGEGEEGEVIE